MPVSSLIADGCTRSGKIEAVPGLHSGLRFSWRPLTVTQLGHFHDAAAVKTPSSLRQLIAEWLAKSITAWDTSGGAINNRVVLQLQPRLFDAVWNVVSGVIPPDEWDEAGPADEAAERKN
jgi:hypothetical protein